LVLVPLTGPSPLAWPVAVEKHFRHGLPLPGAWLGVLLQRSSIWRWVVRRRLERSLLDERPLRCAFDVGPIRLTSRYPRLKISTLLAFVLQLGTQFRHLLRQRLRVKGLLMS